MTKEEAEKEIRDNFTKVWADGIIKALEQEPILDRLKEDIENEIRFWQEPSKYGDTDKHVREAKVTSYKHMLELIDSIKTLEQQSDDVISREQAQTKIEMNASRYTIARERDGIGQVEWSDQLIKVSDAVDIIRKLPPATLQEIKTGHWIKIAPSGIYMCSECEQNVLTGNIDAYHYCHYCGIKMINPHESENEE